VKKAKSRKDQRQDQRLKEDEIRKVSSREQPTNVKKDRKVLRELNAELKVSNFLDAREKRLAELKYLLDIEDDEEEKIALKSEIKALIRNPPPVEIAVENSDDEVVILSKAPSSATCSELPLNRDTHVSPPQGTELWGDDAPSEFGDTEEIVDQAAEGFTFHDYRNQDEGEDDQQKHSDSDTERSISTTASPPVEVPTRVSPRRQAKRANEPPASSSYVTASSSPPTPPGEDLFTEMTRTRGGSKKRKLNKKR
jgi:hypothetical protein